MVLTLFWLIFPCYVPWKHQKTIGFYIEYIEFEHVLLAEVVSEDPVKHLWWSFFFFSENILRLLAAGSFRKKINHRCLTGPGHILDLYCVRLSNAVHFCENYAKIMRKLSFFHRRLPFLANIERCPKFLEHALRALNAPLILFCFCITL